MAPSTAPQPKDFPSLDGMVYFPQDAEYDEQRTKCFAKQNHYERPSCVVTAQTIQDVQKSVRWAMENNVKVAVRSGSHSYTASYLMDETLLLDLEALDQVSNIDPVARTVVVGPGVPGDELNRQLAEHNLCISAGHCAGVKLGGFLVGGGYGWFGDSFGMAADSILEFTIITSQGQVVEVNHPAPADDDWMWLLRGSGVYFPGVWVKAKLKLHPLPKVLEKRSWVYPVEAYPSLVKHMATSRGDEVLTSKMETAVILSILPNHGKVTLVGIACMAESEEEVERMLSVVGSPAPTPLEAFPPKRFRHFGEMAQDTVGVYPKPYFYHCSYVMMPHKTCAKWAAMVLDLFIREAPKEGYSHVLTVIPNTTNYPTKSDKSAYGQHALGSIVLGHYGMYEHSETDDESTAQAWIASANEVLAANPAAHPFKRSVLEDPLFSITSMFPGATGERLVALRRKLDPAGVFATPPDVLHRHRAPTTQQAR